MSLLRLLPLLILPVACGRDPSPVQAAPSTADMVWIPGGTFAMGSVEKASPGVRPAGMDEQPIHRVRITGFYMDRHPVTNAQFRAFIEATGYVTEAERPIDPQTLGVPPEKRAEPYPPGALVFRPPAGPGAVDLNRFWHWWEFVEGASWRHPWGPDSDLEGLDDHPVVQVSHNDAAAYAAWAGKRLPTEAEWEYAARGGKAGQRYVWGAERTPGGKHMANIFQGEFPKRNELADGFARTNPVGAFPANGFGLHGMSGNVWEWCADWYRHDTYRLRAGKAEVVDPQGPPDSFDPQEPQLPKRVTRGGSFLCSDVYCIGYRPSTRMKTSPDTGLCHTGFRCARSGPPPAKRDK